MSGICGIATTGEEVHRKHLECMQETLIHRGPDQDGLWLGKGIGLGHRRLSIIDSEDDRQPLADSSGNLHLVYDGEIYNSREISEELKKEGVDARTLSEPQLVLLAFQRWGKDCLDRFKGMFALALWNEEKEDLFLARDPLGQKPLHYYLTEDKIFFASEIKALLTQAEVLPSLDPDALGKYLAYDYVPAPGCMIRGIGKVMPGGWASWKKGDFQERRYWQADFRPHGLDLETELLPQIDGLIRDSVGSQLEGGVGVGLLLSGGIDSSALLSYMVDFMPADKIKTFHIGFEGESFDERNYATHVARHFSTDHMEEILSDEAILDQIPSYPRLLDEPLADYSLIPSYLLSQLAKKAVNVALSGIGCDEIFVGHENYRAAKYSPHYLKVPKLIRRTVLENWIRRLNPSEKILALDYKLKRFVKGIDFPQPIANYIWLGGLTPSEQNQIFTPEFREQMNDRSLEHIYEEAIEFKSKVGTKNTLDGLLASDLQLFLQDNVLVKNDRASMAASLEVRSPYLDHDLVNLLAQTPLSQKFPRYELKSLLKKVVAKKLPRTIVQRKKMDFGMPLSRWLKKDLSPLVETYLNSNRIRKAGIFQAEFIRRLLDEHRQGAQDHKKVLWALLVFEMWREHYKIS